MANKISTAIEFTTDAAKSSLGSLKNSIGEADGVGGKFKAGFASMKDSVSQNAASIATVAGAALVSFGVKAVGAFTTTAKAAIDLSTATGLSTEEASRWIGVGDDYKVTAEALATGLGKVTKTLDSEKWAKYGIATKDAAGQTRSSNDILLDSFDVLSKVTNKTDQARIGQELFGKGYQSLTPILGHTRAEYEKMLGSVEKGQVITTAEAAKAEKWRLAQDQLGDALHEFTLQVGEEVAGLSPLIVKLAQVVDLIGQAFGPGGLAGGGQFSDVMNELGKLDAEIDKSGHVIDYWAGQVLNGKMTLDQAKQAIKDAATFNADLTTSLKDQAGQTAETARETRKLPVAWEETADAAADALVAQQKVAADAEHTKRVVVQQLAEIEEKWDELTGNVEADKAWVTLQGTFADVQAKFEEANKAITEGTDDASAKTLAYRGALDDVTLSVIDYGRKVLELPPEKLVDIKAALDAGDVQRAEDMLAILTRNREINIDLVGKGAAGYGGIAGARAAGGPVTSGNWLVGEKGPEVVSIGAAGNVTPNSALGGTTNHITINMPVGSNGDDVVRAIQKHTDRNGPGWLPSTPPALVSGGTP